MDTYRKFKKLNINFEAIGFMQSGDDITYFCTPKFAKIIGWAGVDGIHYCFIRGFEGMVFAVSPENTEGKYVHPIAKSFEDLLRLLLACGSMDVIEQAHIFDEASFYHYCEENKPGEEQIEIFNCLSCELGITPMENPFDYIKKLQTEFDYKQIKYSSGYYNPNMNPYAKMIKPEWKVTFDGGFWSNRGRSGKEIPVEKTFTWGEEKWYIPSVYVCSKGLVVDFFMEVSPDKWNAFVEKWDLFHEEEKNYSEEERIKIENDNPLSIDFLPSIDMNGKHLENACRYAFPWISSSCVPRSIIQDTEIKWVLEHYNLDPSLCWSVYRCSFSWNTIRAPRMKSLQLYLEREREEIRSICFKTPEIGRPISFTNPITGMEHTLTVEEYEKLEMEKESFLRKGYHVPTNYAIMTYNLKPDLSEDTFYIRDIKKNDLPSQLLPQIEESFDSSGSVGMIGGADGPTAIFLASSSPRTMHTAVSSLYYKSAEEVEWEMIFLEKRMPDIKVELIKSE